MESPVLPSTGSAGSSTSVHARAWQGDAARRRPTRLFVLSNIPTPYNDALFRAVAARPGVRLRVAYCAEREPNRAWRLPAQKGYDYTILPGRTLGGSVHVNPAVPRLLRAFQPDLAILSGSYLIPSLQLGAVQLALRGIPWLYWGEELRHDHVSTVRCAVQHTLRWPIRRAAGVLAIGQRAIRSYERAGVPRRRIANFTYYPDASRFQLESEIRRTARERIRHDFGIAPDEPVFLFVGQLIHRKGVDVLIDALGRVSARGLRGTLLLVGDGPQRDELVDQVRLRGLAMRVLFAGFAQPEELPSHFAAADVLVLPSRSEGWGLVVPEAFTAGLPVIASEAVNAAAELVEPGRTGWIVPTGDADALGGAMAEYIAAPALRAPMQQAARETAQRQTPEVAAERLEALLAAMLAGEDLNDC